MDNIKYQQSDCVRGQLHNESYFGVIELPMYDEKGKPVMRDGQYVYERDKNGERNLILVMRRDIRSFTQFDDFEAIIDPNVRCNIIKTMESRVSTGMSFGEAIKQDMYMLDKHGNEVRVDRNGRRLCPIRHVRCRVKAGRGCLSISKALPIRTQIYKSKKDYKNIVYAQNAGNYLCLLYDGYKAGKLTRRMRFINYFEISKMKITNVDDIYNDEKYKHFEYQKVVYNLRAVLKNGTHVFMLEEHNNDISKLTQREINKRLFIVYKFNNSGSDVLFLKNSMEARNDKQLHAAGLSKDGDTEYKPSIYQHRLKLVANKCNFLIEGKDFLIDDNEIKLL